MGDTAACQPAYPPASLPVSHTTAQGKTREGEAAALWRASTQDMESKSRTCGSGGDGRKGEGLLSQPGQPWAARDALGHVAGRDAERFPKAPALMAKAESLSTVLKCAPWHRSLSLRRETQSGGGVVTRSTKADEGTAAPSYISEHLGPPPACLPSPTATPNSKTAVRIFPGKRKKSQLYPPPSAS